jgi:hypothetical protein
MRTALLCLIFILTIATGCDAVEKKAGPRATGDSIDDEFYSSVRDETSLGPEIKYPKNKERFTSSSQRRFTGGQVNNVPFASPAEALEVVPGLAVGR